MTTDVTPRSEGPAVVAAAPQAPAPQLTRRNLLRASFWAAIGALVVGGIGSVVNSLYPRGVAGFGGPIVVPASAIPQPGDPPKPVVDGRFLLVNLATGEGNPIGDDTQTSGGLVALYRKCPHLGCTVPWKGDANIAKDPSRTGWFICPCHRSTYTKAGVVVDGPAPRSMDTMAVEVLASGDIVVQTGAITAGTIDNASRAMPYKSRNA